MKKLLLTLTAFAGGYITASLLNPRNGEENRKWITDQSKDGKKWIEEKSQKLVKESEKKIDKMTKGIKKTVNETLPDLYEATEDMIFEGESDE